MVRIDTRLWLLTEGDAFQVDLAPQNNIDAC